MNDPQFLPGDSIVADGWPVIVWQYDSERSEGAVLASIKVNEVALVISISTSKKMALILFKGVIGYVIINRIFKAF